MAEIVQFVETCLRVALGLVFLVSPGIAFWLVVSGLLFMIRRLAGRNLCGAERKGVGAVPSQPSPTS
jgi:hypothetical protein